MEILGATQVPALKINPSEQLLQVLGVPGTAVKQWSIPLASQILLESTLVARTKFPEQVAQLLISVQVAQFVTWASTAVQASPLALRSLPAIHPLHTPSAEYTAQSATVEVRTVHLVPSKKWVLAQAVHVVAEE
jgi:hypothetical protein